MEPKLKIKDKARSLAEAMGVHGGTGIKATLIFLSYRAYSRMLVEIWETASTPEEAMFLAFQLGRYTQLQEIKADFGRFEEIYLDSIWRGRGMYRQVDEEEVLDGIFRGKDEED